MFSQTARTQESEIPLFEISAERKEKEILFSLLDHILKY